MSCKASFRTQVTSTARISDIASKAVDCEKSLFFFRFSKGSAHARERRAAKPRDARNKGGSPFVPRLIAVAN